jgi:uncharacterized glyoxalase superfamily protein PhnB
MKLGYTIIYVADVIKSMDFYSAAFALKVKFLHESKQYGEMATGDTTLAFAHETFAQHNGTEIRLNRMHELPAGIEIAFISENVEEAYEKAVQAGAHSVAPPQEKPWGQKVAFLRDLNGVLIEICSPMAN